MLRLSEISKSFPGIRALKDVSIQINAGEVHAICGENGAGKSTLMNIITGNLQPDSGAIYWRGTQTTIKDVLFAQSIGIGIVYQENSLAFPLTIAENIFPTDVPLTNSGLIAYKRLFARTKNMLNELGMDYLSSNAIVGKLSVAQQQMVEIAKALAKEPSLLILDEPTASLTYSETKILFGIIRQLKSRGTAVIYISHRMSEIHEIADVISILKDGEYMGTVPGTTSAGKLIEMMVGRQLKSLEHESHAQQRVTLEVTNISGKHFHDIRFNLHEGEILGFAGLEGSGRTSLARALFGDEKILNGSVSKNGKAVIYNHPAQAVRNGIGFIPEDRKGQGLFMERTIAENLFSAHLHRGSYSERHVLQEGEVLSKRFNIKTTSIRKTVRHLSGGNQQKVVLAKWLSLEPDALIVNEPTHGVDVGAKAEIYQLLKELTKRGKSILLISSELMELRLLCDRIAVMRNGRIVSIVNRNEATEERITALASGV